MCAVSVLCSDRRRHYWCEHRCYLFSQGLGVSLGARHHHHEIIRVTHEAIRGVSVVAAGCPLSPGCHVTLPGFGEMIVEDRQRNVGQQRRQDAALRCAHLGVSGDAVLGEDTGTQKRLDQRHHAFVSNPIPNPTQQGRMRDLVEACFDVTFEHPVVTVGCQHVDLSNRVMRSTRRTEPVTARVEVRLEDRLEDQLQAGLHDPVPDRGNPETSELARRFGNHPLFDRERLERLGFELGSQPRQHRVTEHDRSRCDPIDAGRSCASIASHPIPRNYQEGRIGDKVEQVIEPATSVVG